MRETPPRMRGRPAIWVRNILGAGNTPAYAGKTLLFTGHRRQAGKHPRVCGEDSFTSSSFAKVRETPPRMRGRRVHLKYGEFPKGNTPAYAGKTATFAES